MSALQNRLSESGYSIRPIRIMLLPTPEKSNAEIESFFDAIPQALVQPHVGLPWPVVYRTQNDGVTSASTERLPLAGASAGLQWWRADDGAELQGGGIDDPNGRPGRVPLWLLAVGVAPIC